MQRPAMRWLGSSVLLLVSLAAAACSENGGGDGGGAAVPLEVNIQVTGIENVHPMMDELDARGMLATLWLGSAEIDTECTAVEAWREAGHELAGKYPTEITEDTTRAAQQEELDAIAETSERCGGSGVVGFRATRFTANDDTYELLEAEGYGYLERSARAEPYSVYTFKPYLLEGHSFAVLPMPIVVYYGQTASMCDNACQDMMSPEELLAYEKKAIELHLRTGEPLVFEWHPGTTYPDDEAGWWGAFTGLLDHLETLGERVQIVTAKQLVERYAQK